ncbi:tigger transposable element-derived protein 1 [Trichonephila clavipes]|nr:tigger transposable element-derived protein 1 [Trichonephila clavipes]
MTTAFFTEWFNNCFVPEVEAYMKEKSLDFKVLLIVDNAASHPQLEHPKVQLVFLPPNTTSLIQPLDQGIIATFKKYYIKTTHKFILNKLENESLTVKDVWKQFSIFDCLIHVASASAQIRPRTLNACWKKIWPACVTDNTTTQTSTLSDEIINLAHEIGGDGFNTFSHDDIDELLVDDTLSGNDIIDLTLDLTVDGVVGLKGDNDEEEKSTSLTGKLIQEGLQLCSKLENHIFLLMPPILNEPLNYNDAKNVWAFSEEEEEIEEMDEKVYGCRYFQPIPREIYSHRKVREGFYDSVFEKPDAWEEGIEFDNGLGTDVWEGNHGNECLFQRMRDEMYVLFRKQQNMMKEIKKVKRVGRGPKDDIKDQTQRDESEKLPDSK